MRGLQLGHRPPSELLDGFEGWYFPLQALQIVSSFDTGSDKGGEFVPSLNRVIHAPRLRRMAEGIA
jgi:hypothetical protein